MQKWLFYLVGIAYFVAFWLCAPRIAVAQTAQLSINSNDTPLVIHGTLDSETKTFSKNIRLTITEGDISELHLLASDLSSTKAPSIVIDRSNISIPEGISLSNRQPRDIRITVNNVEHPGIYTGELKFLLPGQVEANALKVKLEMNIDAKPEVLPVYDNVSFQVVRCQKLVECQLATWLLPDSVAHDKWIVQLNNKTSLPVNISNATVVMQGHKTGNIVSSNQVSLAAPLKLTESSVQPIELTIRRNRLSSDRYEGSLYFKLEDSDDRTVVKATIDVRDGPILPLLIIIVGICIGRLLQDMETPKAKMQVKLQPRMSELKGKITNVNDPDAFEYLNKQFQNLRKKLNSAQESEEVLSQDIDRIDLSADFLIYLETLKKQLQDLGLAALEAEIEPKIKEARQALVEQSNLEAAQKLEREIEQELQEAQQDRTMGSAIDGLKALLEVLHGAVDKLAEVEAKQSPQKPGGSRWNWLARFLAFLSGIRLVNAEIRYWLIRPLLWLLSLIVLVLLGLQTLYVNAGTTFGSAGLYDYLGLFIWGLGADIANQKLSSLQTQKPNE